MNSPKPCIELYPVVSNSQYYCKQVHITFFRANGRKRNRRSENEIGSFQSSQSLRKGKSRDRETQFARHRRMGFLSVQKNQGVSMPRPSPLQQETKATPRFYLQAGQRPAVRIAAGSAANKWNFLEGWFPRLRFRCFKGFVLFVNGLLP